MASSGTVLKSNYQVTCAATSHDGWFLAVRYRDGKGATRRAKALPKRVAETAETRDISLRFALVDARRPVSASNIKPTTGGLFGRYGRSARLQPNV